MSSNSDSLKGKWNNLTTGSKAAILCTILISIILIAIFLTVMIGSTRSSIYAPVVLLAISQMAFNFSGKTYDVRLPVQFIDFADVQVPMAAGHDQSGVDPVAQSPVGGGSGGDFESVAVEAHNAARRKVLNGQVPNQPAASKMPDLQYDSTLAAHASSWSRRCQMGHSEDTHYGENIYYNTMKPDDANFHMKTAVQNWFDEHKQFQYPNSCGGACGHYTQVVWANSKKVGCGFTTCNGIAGWVGSKAVMLVCNYDPPGNFNNEPPYRT